MFSRRQRLPRAHFPTSPARVRRVSSPHFTLVGPATGTGYAVVVAKKVARRSVDRHLLKRRVSAALQSLPLPPALIVYPRALALTLSPGAMRAELTELLSKMGGHP